LRDGWLRSPWKTAPSACPGSNSSAASKANVRPAKCSGNDRDMRHLQLEQNIRVSLMNQTHSVCWQGASWVAVDDRTCWVEPATISSTAITHTGAVQPSGRILILVVRRRRRWKDTAQLLKPLCRKRHSFLEFSLCLSRACLGKTIMFSIKWDRKKTRFLTCR
jgi:hypothetical protein